MKQANSSYDLVIAGAGFAGLSLAVACQTALGPLFRILVVDPSPGNLAPHRDRASAIAADGKRLFVALGVWEAIEPHAQPIRAMIITDSKVTDPIRPRFLTFDETSPGAALAHMIEHDVLLEALLMRVQTLGVCVEQNRVETFKADAHGVSIQLSSGEALTARLLVAADGARSRLREQAGLPTSQWHYGQSAIVATIHHERDHEGRAYEHFLPSGPFAILPSLDGDPQSFGPRAPIGQNGLWSLTICRFTRNWKPGSGGNWAPLRLSDGGRPFLSSSNLPGDLSMSAWR